MRVSSAVAAARTIASRAPRGPAASAIFTLAVSALAACSSPPPPTIPGRDVVGPPREAATLCTPPTSKFAQAWFQIADLETGHACTAFVEQDECIVAVFRDCTDVASTPERSWQGQIDHDMRVSLERSRESTGGVGTRAPLDCAGPLEKSDDEPSWVKMSCRLSSSETVPHRGLYFEAVEVANGPKFPRVGAHDHTVAVAMSTTPRDPYVTDLAVRPSARELWAVVDGGGDGTTGLYFGAIDVARLDKLTAPLLTAPSIVRTTLDEKWIVVADGGALHRLDARTHAPIAPIVEPEPILAIEPALGGILVARTSTSAAADPKTHLVLFSADDATTVLASATVTGRVAAIVPLAGGASAALAIAGQRGAPVVDAALHVARTIELGDVPHAITYAAGADAIVFTTSNPTRLRVVPLGSTAAWELSLPGAGDGGGIAYDAVSGRALVATSGAIVPVDLDGARPILQGSVAIEGRTNVLRVDPMRGTVLALRGPAGYVEVFEPTP